MKGNSGEAQRGANGAGVSHRPNWLILGRQVFLPVSPSCTHLLAGFFLAFYTFYLSVRRALESYVAVGAFLRIPCAM